MIGTNQLSDYLLLGNLIIATLHLIISICPGDGLADIFWRYFFSLLRTICLLYLVSFMKLFTVCIHYLRMYWRFLGPLLNDSTPCRFFPGVCEWKIYTGWNISRRFSITRLSSVVPLSMKRGTFLSTLQTLCSVQSLRELSHIRPAFGISLLWLHTTPEQY